MKYTKTQLQLLENARNYGGTYSITTSYGRGPKGGKTVSHGARDRDALLKLEELGLVEITDRQPWQFYTNGWRQHGASIAFKLTEKAAK
jgi:hypothetical protein